MGPIVNFQVMNHENYIVRYGGRGVSDDGQPSWKFFSRTLEMVLKLTLELSVGTNCHV